MHIGQGNYAAQVDASHQLSLRCPVCRNRGTFDRVLSQDGQFPDRTVIGIRRCPDIQCRAHVFFVQVQGQGPISFPLERIDFDATNIPAQVLRSFEEAVACHASQCYTAAAIMVRKTLEELCRDRGATGGSLKARLESLGSKVILPPELLQGLDDLRLLGNDAAHVESQEFNSVGQEEVEVGLEFAKEVLKAVFQYSSLLQRLRALKKGQ